MSNQGETQRANQLAEEKVSLALEAIERLLKKFSVENSTIPLRMVENLKSVSHADLAVLTPEARAALLAFYVELLEAYRAIEEQINAMARKEPGAMTDGKRAAAQALGKQIKLIARLIEPQ